MYSIRYISDRWSNNISCGLMRIADLQRMFYLLCSIVCTAMRFDMFHNRFIIIGIILKASCIHIAVIYLNFIADRFIAVCL